MATALTKPEPLSARWWLDRLYSKLRARQDELDFYDAYYRGEFPLPWLAPQAQDDFRRVLRMTRSNYMGLVADAKAERAQIEGFRLATDEASDSDTWRIWQANHMDVDSDQAILESLIGGVSYTLVEPNYDDPSTPHIFVEHAAQAIVEHMPGTNRRVAAAGLKVWDDDWTGELHGTLYLPGWLWKVRAPRPLAADGGTTVAPSWSGRPVAGEEWPARNPLGEVPLEEIPNNPRLLTGGVSELADVTDVQDRINKTIADRLITQDFGAFPQKWAAGWPEADEDGTPTPPIRIGRDRILTTAVSGQDAKFGQFDSAALDPYSAAKREDVKDIASRTRTPAQYLLGEMSNVNGETLKAAESGLVSAVRSRCRGWGEGFENTARRARRTAGLPDGGPAIEVVWRNPEYRTPGETMDAAIKARQSGLVTLRQAREDVGYSVTQIERMEQQDGLEADPLVAGFQRALDGTQ